VNVIPIAMTEITIAMTDKYSKFFSLNVIELIDRFYYIRFYSL
jgi:hypothetical protein